MKRFALPAITLIIALACAVAAWQQTQRAAQLDQQLASAQAALRKEADTQKQTQLARAPRSENDGYISEVAALR
ncbi:MAG: hypothetical protein M3Q89_13210 [Verrucomicrobiota bacterium]|nr:hypothetical protein [Verrucomicrobiota bacterium]